MNFETQIHIRAATANENTAIRRELEQANRWTHGWESGVLLVLCRPDDASPVAWVRHWPSPQGRHIILNVTVVEKYRGHRYGLRVMSHMMLSMPHIEKWYLDCKPALAGYYARLGFETVDRGECPELFEDNSPDQLCMACVREKFAPFTPSF